MRTLRLRPVTILKAAAERAASSAMLLKALLGMSALLLALAPPTARGSEAESGHNFQFCNGYFALCAASTCSPTGKMIKVNVAGGGTAMFPQVDCKCPIFHGRAIADVTGATCRALATRRSRGQVKSGRSFLMKPIFRRSSTAGPRPPSRPRKHRRKRIRQLLQLRLRCRDLYQQRPDSDVSLSEGRIVCRHTG
jgi:hypothetical protein